MGSSTLVVALLVIILLGISRSWAWERQHGGRKNRSRSGDSGSGYTASSNIISHHDSNGDSGGDGGGGDGGGGGD